MKKNKVIDVHHHVFPPDHAVHKWDIQSDIAAMERCGVTDVYLSCPLVTDSSTAHSFNEYMASQVKVCPEHYKMLGALPYDNVNAALDEISYILDDLGAPGFGLNTHNHDIYMGDDSLDVIFEELNRRQAVIVLHPCHKRHSRNEKILFTGNDSVYEYTFDTTRAVMDFVFKDKVRRWPDIRWIMPHAGGTIPFLAHRMSISGRWGCIEQHEDEIMDILKSFYYDLALNNCELNYSFLKGFVGADHLLFGSDYPAGNEAMLSDDLKELDRTEVFSETEKTAILSGNVGRLFAL